MRKLCARRCLRVASSAFAVLALILLLISGMLHSPTLDEPGHLASGCLCVEFGIFDLYEVNPPLVKSIAALPVTYCNPRYDWKALSNAPGVRCEWTVGRHFVSANGAQSFRYFTIARWALLSIWCLGCVVVHKWATLLGGPTAGFAAILLWCFSIEVHAWTPTLSADSSFASLAVMSTWLFRKWLVSTNERDAMLLGFSLGLTVLAKSSGVLLFLVFPACIVFHVYRISWHVFRQWMLCVVIAILILNCGYRFDRTCQKLGDFRFFSRSLAGPKADGSSRLRIESELGNKFTHSLLSNVPVPIPASFLEGIDLQKYDFESVNWSYLRHTQKFGVWWHSYLQPLLVKTPVGTLGLFFITCGWAFWRIEWPEILSRAKRAFTWDKKESGSFSPTLLTSGGEVRYEDLCNCSPVNRQKGKVDRAEPVLHENLVLLAPAVCLFILVGSQIGLNRYLRYVLPCYPFIMIWMSQIFAENSGFPEWLRKACWGFLAWSVISCLAIFPHSVSYSNEIAGGPENGRGHSIDANIDLGQDVLFLADWIKDHPESRPAYVSVHAGFDPRTAGIDHELLPIDPRFAKHMGNLTNHQSVFAWELSSIKIGPQPGWYAISVHHLYSPTKEFAYLFDFPKKDTVGYSIYIYHLTEDDVSQWNAEHRDEFRVDAEFGADEVTEGAAK